MYKCICEYCGIEFEAEKPRRFHNAKCRMQASKQKKPVKICEICGAEFHPFHNRQVTCGAKDCVQTHINNVKKAQRKKELKSAPKPKKKKKLTAADWKALTPSQRWELMTLEEISAEVARFHMTFGQARVLKERRELPFDFGEKRGAGNEIPQ